jgi:DMSO reductase family type II enzyme chaperone
MAAPTESQVSAALLRASLYQFMALAFSYPAEDYRNRLTTRWGELPTCLEDWPEGVQARLEAAVTALHDQDDSTLAPEYLRLFGPAAASPLFETSYGIANQLLGKPARLADVSGFYHAFGMHPTPGETYPEDHLTLETEFMGVLALKEAYALSIGDEEPLFITRDAARKFLEEHLGTWTNAWLELLKTHAPPVFYARLGETLCALVDAEAQRLGAVITPQPAIRLEDREVGSDHLNCPLA